MQVYRHMDIGSAKITLEEMLGVPHHMIDVVEPDDEMDVARYAAMAKACIRDVTSRGKIPVLCGGTGFYIQAVVRDIDFTETTPDEAYRAELRALAEKEGTGAVHRLLADADPGAAKEIHPNNLKRVIRALEFYKETGRRISEHNVSEKQKESPYDLIYFYIDADRGHLYERIDRRVDFMMAAGLADEVAFLRAQGLTRSCVSMQGIGYKEILDALDGVITMEEAVRIIKRDSRRYAKRQETWFRRERHAIRLVREEFGDDTRAILRRMIEIIEEKTDIRAKEVRNPYE